MDCCVSGSIDMVYCTAYKSGKEELWHNEVFT